MFDSGQMSVVAGAAAQPHGVGVQQLYDGTEYWGEWQGGKMHGWGVWRTIDGETEYRGQLFDVYRAVLVRKTKAALELKKSDQ